MRLRTTSIPVVEMRVRTGDGGGGGGGGGGKVSAKGRKVGRKYLPRSSLALSSSTASL